MYKNALLLLGSNIGNKLNYINKAITLLEKSVGPISKRSSVYATEPWGNAEQDFYLNQAIELNTALSPKQLLTEILNIETLLGRIRSNKWSARIIDIDILFYESDIINEKNLKIPHPLIQERKFVLLPLFEIYPDFFHPALKKTVRHLLNDCPDKLSVTLL